MALKVWYTNEYTDEKGKKWFSINGDTHYSLASGWTKEDAINDYTSPEHYIEDQVNTMRVFGFYD